MSNTEKSAAVFAGPGVVPLRRVGAQSERPRGASATIVKFPRRPRLEVLSETIPLFYIARTGRGFWLAREAEGRCGGTFLTRRAALRFGRMRSAPAGCAMMFLNEPLELDLADEGNRFLPGFCAALEAVSRRWPRLADYAGGVVGAWRAFTDPLSEALAGERRNRLAIERDLFHGWYRLCSKNDDDLLVP